MRVALCMHHLFIHKLLIKSINVKYKHFTTTITIALIFILRIKHTK